MSISIVKKTISTVIKNKRKNINDNNLKHKFPKQPFKMSFWKFEKLNNFIFFQFTIEIIMFNLFYNNFSSDIYTFALQVNKINSFIYTTQIESII